MRFRPLQIIAAAAGAVVSAIRRATHTQGECELPVRRFSSGTTGAPPEANRRTQVTGIPTPPHRNQRQRRKDRRAAFAAGDRYAFAR